jgi:hypothetical protein
MARGSAATCVPVSLALALSACASPPPQTPTAKAGPAPAGEASGKAVYAVMDPVDHYRMAPASEEALARSAAPASVSQQADVLVLGDHGYTQAEKGSNGFVCLVERSWAKEFDDPEFWNSKIRAPICLNRAAARSVLPSYLKRTEWVLASVSKADIADRVKSAVASKEITPPEIGAMCFMMSKDQNLGDDDGNWHPHLMFFLPSTTPADWGANLQGSPVFALQSAFEPVTIFLSPVRRWSDGTIDAPKP